jgi:very-short-patch-repair endonuclease
MKITVCSKDEMVANIQKSRSMREAAKLCNMSYSSFRRYAQQYGVYEPEKPTRFQVCYSVDPNIEQQYCCRHCGKLCQNLRSLRMHESKCPKNAERVYVSYTKGRTAWNKGLTKESNDSVAQYAKKISENYANGSVLPNIALYKWTEERRRQQSERKKKLYKEHPEKHPNIMCAANRCNLTYPEQVTYDWLSAYGMKPIHNYHFVTDVSNRYVDFYVPRYNLFIEVDGEYWHKNKTRDQAKDLDAKRHGKITLRIKPKQHIVSQLVEFFEELKY